MDCVRKTNAQDPCISYWQWQHGKLQGPMAEAAFGILSESELQRLLAGLQLFAEGNTPRD